MLTCKVSMVQFTLCVGGGWFSQSSEKKLLNAGFVYMYLIETKVFQILDYISLAVLISLMN